MSVDDSVVWEEPPSPRIRGDYAPAIEALKERPGEWARVAVFTDSGKASSLAQALRVRRGQHLEARSHRIDAELVGVWARIKPYMNGEAS